MSASIIESLDNAQEVINQTKSDLLYAAKFDYTMADTAYDHIMTEVKEFQETLDSDHEVGILLASFGQSTLMVIEDIGFQNPNLMYFYGTINGNASQLVQHISQLNFVLMSVAKQPDKPARRIGFHFDEEPEESD